MSINSKSEKIALSIVTILYFLLVKGYFLSSIYALSVCVLSIYFFPVKIILNRKAEHFYLKIVSYFIIALALVLSYVVYIIGDKNETLEILLSLLGLSNVFMMYKLAQMKDVDKNLHVIIMFLIALSLFV